ncbi:MAG: MBL fold metallo-hydrolase [Acidobacteria bacterium]|nr:MBL fold metallo-hydrolase [Acidobacteriota bacterium]
MSEPKSRAHTIDHLESGILHWSVHDDRIDSRSEAYAIRAAGWSVLIDPLPLDKRLLGELKKVEAICLTASCHQRAAWRYRKEFATKVYAPLGAEGLEEKPDAWYKEGEFLLGGLKAVHTPGPAAAHYAFHFDRGRALFCADILISEGGKLGFVPAKYQDDPKRTRIAAARFLKLPFSILCCAHGAPITEDPHTKIREALETDKLR